MIPGDRTVVTVAVPVPPAVAWTAFTEDIDRWWRRSIRYRIGANRGTMSFEPGVGGRLVEAYETEGGPRTFVIGRVTAWQPPEHLAFEWRNQSFAPGEVTFVDVRFTATERGTRVVLEHSGLAALRPDHPARHGAPVSVFLGQLGMWWGELLRSLGEHVAPDE